MPSRTPHEWVTWRKKRVAKEGPPDGRRGEACGVMRGVVWHCSESAQDWMESRHIPVIRTQLGPLDCHIDSTDLFTCFQRSRSKNYQPS